MTMVGSITAKLLLDASGYIKGITLAERSTNKFSSTLGLLAASYGAKRVMTGSIQSFMEFEKALTKASSVMTSATGDMKRNYAVLEEAALRTSRTTEFTARQMSDSLVFLGMAGQSTAQSIGSLPHVARLASASGIDLAKSANIVTNVMAGYGVQVNELSKANNVLVGTFTNSNVNLLELGSAFKVIGPIAKQVGVSIEETSAAIGMLGNAGIKGTDAGTGLKNMFKNILSPSEKMKGAMRELGIEGFSFAEDGIVGLIEKLEEANKEIGDGEQFVSLLNKAFEQRAAPKLAALVQQGSAELKKLIGSIEEAVDTDAAKRLEAAALATLQGQWNLMKSSIESASIKMSASIEEDLVSIIKRIKQFADALGDADPATQRFIARAFGLSSAILAVDAAFKLFTGRMVVLPLLGKLAKGFFGVTSSAMGLLSLVTNVKDFFVVLKIGAESAMGSMMKFIRPIGTAISWIGRLVLSLGALKAGLIAIGAVAWLEVFLQLKEPFKNFLEWLRLWGSSFKETFFKLMDDAVKSSPFLQGLKNGFQDIKRISKTVAEDVSKFFNNAFKSIDNFFKNTEIYKTFFKKDQTPSQSFGTWDEMSFADQSMGTPDFADMKKIKQKQEELAESAGRAAERLRDLVKSLDDTISKLQADLIGRGFDKQFGSSSFGGLINQYAGDFSNLANTDTSNPKVKAQVEKIAELMMERLAYDFESALKDNGISSDEVDRVLSEFSGVFDQLGINTAKIGITSETLKANLADVANSVKMDKELDEFNKMQQEKIDSYNRMIDAVKRTADSIAKDLEDARRTFARSLERVARITRSMFSFAGMNQMGQLSSAFFRAGSPLEEQRDASGNVTRPAESGFQAGRAIGAAAGGIWLMIINKIMEFVSKLEPVVDMFTKLSDHFSKMLGETLGSFMEALEPLTALLVDGMEALRPIFEAVSDIFAGLIKGFTPLIKAINEFSRIFGDVIGGVLQALAPAFESLGSILSTILVPVFRRLGEALRTVEPLLRLLANAISGILKVISFGMSEMMGDDKGRGYQNQVFTPDIVADFDFDSTDAISRSLESINEQIEEQKKAYQSAHDAVEAYMNTVHEFERYNGTLRGSFRPRKTMELARQVAEGEDLYNENREALRKASQNINELSEAARKAGEELSRIAAIERVEALGSDNWKKLNNELIYLIMTMEEFSSFLEFQGQGGDLLRQAYEDLSSLSFSELQELFDSNIRSQLDPYRELENMVADFFKQQGFEGERLRFFVESYMQSLMDGMSDLSSDDASAEIQRRIAELAEVLGEGADSLRSTSREMSNVPSGFKLAKRRFESAMEELLGEPAQATHPADSLRDAGEGLNDAARALRDAANDIRNSVIGGAGVPIVGGGGIRIENMTIQTDDPDRFSRELQRTAARRNSMVTGSPTSSSILSGRSLF